MSNKPVTCPACGGPHRPSARYIAVCVACGHRWLLATAEEYAVVEAGTYTHDYAGYRADPKFLQTATVVTAAELATRVPPPARVLDVGCGAGDFMKIAMDLGYTVQGLDISEASAEICRKRGLDARAGNFLTEHFSEKFDLITMWDVVEHLRDPGSFLERARSLLTDRGYVFAKIPCFGNFSVSLSNASPRVAGTLLGAPSHVQYFDRESLTKLLSRTGFQPEWIAGGRARSETTGGSLKRRLARRARSLIRQVSGDANLYVAGRPVN